MSTMIVLIVSISMMFTGTFAAPNMTAYAELRDETGGDFDAIEIELAKLTDGVNITDAERDMIRGKPFIGPNAGVIENLYQGDIMPTLEQAKAISNNIEATKPNPNGKRSAMNIIAMPQYKWTMPIKYSFDSESQYDSEEKSAIRAGIKMWTDISCVQFVEDSSSQHRLEVVRGGSCSSAVGMMESTYTQYLSLGNGCADPATAAHEFGHALGLWHEQTRVDRANVLTIEAQNILPGMAHNYDMDNPSQTTNEGIPYDMGSVMQYAADSFLDTSKGDTVMRAHNSLMQKTMGANVGPSFNDGKLINKLYCADVCQGSSVVCQNGGYPSVKDCSRCTCPDGLGGRTCNQVATSDVNGCGHVTATSSWKSKSIGRVALNENCFHKIEAADSNDVVEVYVEQKYSIGYSDPCTGYIEVKTDDSTVAGVRWCLVSDQPAEVMRANGPVAYVLHRTAEQVMENTGYTLHYRTVPSGASKTTQVPQQSVNAVCNEDTPDANLSTSTQKIYRTTATCSIVDILPAYWATHSVLRPALLQFEAAGYMAQVNVLASGGVSYTPLYLI